MVACTRCGRWHLDAEKVLDRKLSCTDVKQYWSKIREEHLKLKGHPARISTDAAGQYVCMKCRCKL